MPVCAEPAQRARRAAWRALTPRGANTHSLPPSGPPVAHRRLRTRAGGRRGRACCLRGRTCRAILRRRRPPPARWALREGARRRGDGRASQAARAGRRCAAAPRGRHASLSSRQHTAAAPLLGASAPRRPACCCMWRGATEAGPRASACGALRGRRRGRAARRTPKWAKCSRALRRHATLPWARAREPPGAAAAMDSDRGVVPPRRRRNAPLFRASCDWQSAGKSLH